MVKEMDFSRKIRFPRVRNMHTFFISALHHVPVRFAGAPLTHTQGGRVIMRRTVVASFVSMLLAVSASAEVILEPFTYSENFETREECAWASYPQWQDTAYDQNFRANTIVPGDPNISIVQLVTPYSNVDNYAGAMKELDAYLTPDTSIKLRCYLKTNLPVESFTVRLAGGSAGKLDVVFKNPPTNRWEWITVTGADFIRENPKIANVSRVKVNGMAVLAKIPNADPAMPIYLGLDDVTYAGYRAMTFRFAEPEMVKLAEWKPFIPRQHYRKGGMFTLRGSWPLDATRVWLSVTSFTDTTKTVLGTSLKHSGDEWSLPNYPLTWPEGLYRGRLTAFKGNESLAETEFTLSIAPVVGGNHPRLWFSGDREKWVKDRFMSERFTSVRDGIMNGAKTSRTELPVDKIVWDLDQLPDENWLGTLGAWSTSRVGVWRRALHNNAFAYGFGGDREAGEYCKNLLMKISTFPYIVHPWMLKRGHHIYYPVGEFGIEMALAYDFCYDLMTDEERKTARDAMMRFVVEACHKGYVEDDLVISNTSNWVSHITCGSLMCQAAIYGDAPDMAPLEPYFTGALMKNHEFLQKVVCRDGEWGEGYGYYNFSMSTLSNALPAVENVFKIDLSAKLNGSYKGLIWAGRHSEKESFLFGDSNPGPRPLTHWAWLLPKYKDPLLGYMYGYLKTSETIMDVLYETADVPKKDPVGEPPVKLFRDAGTTVFKSGWGKDDFVFVMRTGPFVNHQHLDQGTFWFADRGTVFVEERHGSTYYDDPNYQPWYTQPVGHSTILIDGNHHGQRVGDLLWHMDGFDDYAFMGQFLDGTRAAFSSGDIGRLYWGKVKGIQRNVLYLKPRMLLMLDTVTPADVDADVTLLYQTLRLGDITPGIDESTITKDGNTLHVRHLFPAAVKSEAVETPHYLYTIRDVKPLVKEGMLTVTARTAREPLVMANLLSATEAGGKPDCTVLPGEGCMSGVAGGIPFAFSTRPGKVYTVNGMTTDAVAVAGTPDAPFAAMATVFRNGATLVMESAKPVTFERSANAFRYNATGDGELTLGVSAKPVTVSLNGKPARFVWNAAKSAVVLTITGGDGVVTVK